MGTAIRLDEFRKKKGLSIQEIAETIGISREYLHELKNPNSKKTMTLDHLYDIAKVVGCKPSELLPIEWQSQPQQHPVNEDLLVSLIERTLKGFKEAGFEPDPKKVGGIVVSFYQEITEKGQEVSDNSLDLVIKYSTKK